MDMCKLSFCPINYVSQYVVQMQLVLSAGVMAVRCSL